jgi:hypothetical protein
MTTAPGPRRLDDLADVRAGDKGDTLIVAVFARDRAAYDYLAQHLTVARVTAHFGGLVSRTPRRSLQTNLLAMVFELPGVLGGGVTGSPVLDSHGKTLSYHLLDLAV